MTEITLNERSLDARPVAGATGSWPGNEMLTPRLDHPRDPLPLDPLRLDHLRPGDTCRVVALLGGGAVRRRLLDMGLVPSVRVEMIRNAPLRDPIEIRVHNTFMTLRRVEANRIAVAAGTGP